MDPPSPPATSHTTPTPPRLSLPLPSRLALSTTLTFPSTFLLGLLRGSHISSLRFRAENAHRLPKSQVGWYLYHKSKTYASLLGGVKEGVRNGVRVSFWSAVFLGCEEVVDRGRRMGGVVGLEGMFGGAGAGAGAEGGEDRRGKGSGTGGVDALGTVVASLATAGAFCLWNRFPYSMAVRTAKRGLAFGLVYGVAQDILRAAKGDGVAAWMRWLGVGERRMRRDTSTTTATKTLPQLEQSPG
ncbi:hypothetical protein BGX38DRAFT_1164881 [Terfezia claveryi]|nr:hypothetical protein BGX38DRAFT_1164881 [Terfezia claveryi]